jgi:N-acetylneuraminic acid mutarotase
MDTAVRVYDPATGRWRDGPRLPAARSHGVLVSDGQRLYFMGGLNGEIRGLQTVYRLDSPDGAWTEDSPLPGGRFSGAAVWDGRRIVFAGGAELDKPRRAASDVWALESGRWARIGALASPREHLAAATDGSGTAWFLGGADVAAGSTGLSADVDVVRGSTVAPAQPLANPRQGLTAVWTSASGVCAIGGSTSQPNAAPRPVATVSCLGGGRAWPDLPRPTYLGASATVADTVYVVAGTEMFLLHLPS